MRVPPPSFTHLLRLTDAGGLYEHARGDRPRPEHGYCVDDVARGLVVTSREPGPDETVRLLAAAYLDFVVAAQSDDGRFHNRRGTDLTWRDDPTLEDCWGRALWGLGSVVDVVGPHPGRARALAAFERGAGQRSPWPRATAFAGLGAAAVLHHDPDHALARALLGDAADMLSDTSSTTDATLARNGWLWPEDRLRYANAVLPEVLLAAGHALHRPELVSCGLQLLDWLLGVQTRDGHLSVVPVAGLGPGGGGPGFDQQPIEVAALADACARAHQVTGDAVWLRGVRLAVGWFLGDNDSRTPMLDADTGGGYDGLERDGRNDNQGAESTLAMLSTLQHGRALLDDPAARSVPAEALAR